MEARILKEVRESESDVDSLKKRRISRESALLMPGFRVTDADIFSKISNKGKQTIM